jgi:hypothetical protein
MILIADMSLIMENTMTITIGIEKIAIIGVTIMSTNKL